MSLITANLSYDSPQSFTLFSLLPLGAGCIGRAREPSLREGQADRAQRERDDVDHQLQPPRGRVSAKTYISQRAPQ